MPQIIEEVRREAERVFAENMEKHNFSFSAAALYNAAFGDDGLLKDNWKLAMMKCVPNPREHPDLYKPVRFEMVRYFERSKIKEQRHANRI